MEKEKTGIIQKLLKASEILFAEKGFEGTSVDEIAKKAKINKAMIYYYFSSKEGLFVHLVQKYFSEFDMMISKVEIKPGKSSRSIIHELLEIAIDYIAEHANIIKIVHVETLLKKPTAKIDIFNFIEPIWQKLENQINKNYPELQDIAFADKVLIISSIINYVTIKERVSEGDKKYMEKVKSDYIERLTDIIFNVTQRK
jgi:AcrR family transcriptional regulator